MAFGKNTLDAEQHNRIAQVLHHLGIIAERAEQGVVITDREGTIHFANTAWASMHGYTKSTKILGRGITSFFDKSSAPASGNLTARDSLIQLVKQAKAFGCATAVLQHQKLDRSIFPSRDKIIALKDKNGCPNALIFFSTDISEIEKLQKQLAQTTQELQNSRLQIDLLKQQLESRKNQPTAVGQPAVSTSNTPDLNLTELPALRSPQGEVGSEVEALNESNQPSSAPPKTEEVEQTCPEHPVMNTVEPCRGKNPHAVSVSNPPLTQILLESKIISTCSERVESTQYGEPNNSSKNPKPAPRPFNAERLKALAYLSRRLNELPTEAPRPPLHKSSDGAYPDDENLENPPPLLDIEQLKAIAEIAKRLV